MCCLFAPISVLFLFIYFGLLNGFVRRIGTRAHNTNYTITFLNIYQIIRSFRLKRIKFFPINSILLVQIYNAFCSIQLIILQWLHEVKLLSHYDIRPDNIVYDPETKRISVIGMREKKTCCGSIPNN